MARHHRFPFLPLGRPQLGGDDFPKGCKTVSRRTAHQGIEPQPQLPVDENPEGHREDHEVEGQPQGHLEQQGKAGATTHEGSINL
jgi:hypothetical protein